MSSYASRSANTNTPTIIIRLRGLSIRNQAVSTLATRSRATLPPCPPADRSPGRCYHTCRNNRGGIMADLSSQFEQAVADSKNLPERPDNMTLLKLYALYKQATTGDVDGKRPGFTDMVGRAKWDAWNELKGTDRDGAMKQYIALVDSLKG